MEKILLLGANGQLGQTLLNSGLSDAYSLTAFTRAQLDISNQQAVMQMLDDLRPDLIINAAAYTAVDAAESNADSAYAVNAQGVQNLAEWTHGNAAHLIHLSTDFVFDGRKNTPYVPEDSTNPLSVYGKSKLAGEQALQSILQEQGTIIRTSWLYSPYGSNFVKTMLALMQKRDQIGVVVDQIGTPCSTATLADCISAAVNVRPGGIFHFSDAGVASWYDFAIAIQEEALHFGLLSDAIPITPISSSAYPTQAQRPTYSVFDKSKTVSELQIEQQHWRRALHDMMKKLPV